MWPSFSLVLAFFSPVKLDIVENYFLVMWVTNPCENRLFQVPCENGLLQLHNTKCRNDTLPKKSFRVWHFAELFLIKKTWPFLPQNKLLFDRIYKGKSVLISFKCIPLS